MRSATTTRDGGSQGGHRGDPWAALRTAAAVTAAAFLLVGVAGFIPGITTHADDIEFAGPQSGTGPMTELLGVFHVSALHSLVHLAFGVVGLALARTARGAKSFLVGGGVAYLVVLVYGLLVDHDSDANFLPLNTADNWLHAALAAAMIGLGLALADRRDDRTAGPADAGVDTSAV